MVVQVPWRVTTVSAWSATVSTTGPAWTSTAAACRPGNPTCPACWLYLACSTAPAGYTCPGCSAPVFPPDNLVSPVADKLRSQLSEVNWARPGLGLPLLADSQERRPPQVGSTTETYFLPLTKRALH